VTQRVEIAFGLLLKTNGKLCCCT